MSDMLAAYQRAAAIYNANEKKHVLNESIKENWIQGSDDFWFSRDVLDDKGEVKSRYERYFHAERLVKPLFDHEQLAAALRTWNEKSKALDLGVTIHEVRDEKLYFSIKDTVGEFLYDLDTQKIQALRYELHKKDEVTSPDLKFTAYVQDYNCFVRDNDTGKVSQLTRDGRPGWDYGQRFNMVSEGLLKKEPRVFPPAIKWSPDSKSFLTYRRDSRRVDDLHLVQSSPINKEPRPIGSAYPYSLPADEAILTAQVYLMDVEKKETRKIMLDGDILELLLLSMFDSDDDLLKWTEDSKEAYLVRYDRYFKTAQAIIIDRESGEARLAASHGYDTFGFTEYFGHASQEYFMDSGLLYLPQSRELIWLTEEEEGASLYRLDADTGAFKDNLTPGSYCVRRIRYWDPDKQDIYFSASGKEADVDPYYQFLYCLNLETGDLVKLSQEDGEHRVRFHKKGLYYIDSYSTIQTAPKTQVCDREGQVLCHLATADLSRIMDLGYVTPEPFQALARDGKTPIYGILIKPHDFDPTKKYPLVDYIYGGAQRINTPKAFEFHAGMLGPDPQGGLQSLAQLGFVGLIVDGLATPLRGKAIHDMTYGKAEECCGLEDHVHAIRQLAERFSWIDLDRVGIWGASGGGYATARALLQFPDFYKVGVSLCGNHDQAKYHAHWGERWIGPYSKESYHNQANRNFADQLKGHLLLIHGDMDDNVHPSATLDLADALIDANKDFDMLIYPNSAHGVGMFPYVVRRRWDYFVRHLLGQKPPHNFLIREKKDED